MNIGLTGSIGCGKSTVVGFFSGAGWKTVETDRLVADLLHNDVLVRNQIRERWGTGLFKSGDGDVDRKAIARIVFSDSAELNWLEGLLHPIVRQRWIHELDSDGSSLCLVEIPLLFEKSLESHFDLVVCIASDNSVADSRLALKGHNSSDIAQRRSRQLSLDDKIRLSDHMLFNSGSIEFLKRQTLRLIQHIQPQSR
jgi:dephospho-CoA kinase